MILKTQLYKYLFLVYIFGYAFIPSFELKFLLLFTLFLVAIFFSENRVSAKLIEFSIPLIFIMGIGISITILNFSTYSIYDIIKDVTYFLKPILELYLGYLFMKNIIKPDFVFKTILIIGLFFAFKHVFGILINENIFNTSINYIRNEYGKANQFELVSLIFCVSAYKYGFIKNYLKKFSLKFIIILFVISYILYFSRTMLVSFILVLIPIFGYGRINTKTIKIISIGILAILLFYGYLFNTDLQRDGTGIESFLYKIKIAPSEIFQAAEIDKENHQDLWDNWRAYEAQQAISQMNYFNFFVGKGFGALIDLEMVSPLNEEGIQYIPIIHNGYVYIFFKTGIIGLIFYLIFLISIYLKIYIRTDCQIRRFYGNLCSGIGFYFLFTTLIITGIYNSGQLFMLILGMSVFLSEPIKSHENSNIRD